MTGILATAGRVLGVTIAGLAMAIALVGIGLPLYILLHTAQSAAQPDVVLSLRSLPEYLIDVDTGRAIRTGDEYQHVFSTDSTLIVVDPVAISPISEHVTLRITIDTSVPYTQSGAVAAGPPGQLGLFILHCEESPCADEFVRIPQDFTREGVGGSGLTIDVSLRSTGSPEAFPGDQYTFFTALRMGVLNGSDTRLLSQVQPFDVFIINQRLSTFDLVEHPAPPGSRLFHEVNTTLQRTPLQQGFVYAVASTPFVFALVIGGVLLTSTRAGQLELAALYVGLAAAGLVILPLRSTVVPPDIQGVVLTRLDLVLAVALGALTGLAAIGHLLWAIRRKRDSAMPPHEAPHQPARPPIRTVCMKVDIRRLRIVWEFDDRAAD